MLNSEAAERRHGAVKNGMRVMNQASSIGSFQNRAGGMGGAKYPSRQEIESFQNQLTPESIKSLSARMDACKSDSVQTTIPLKDLTNCLNAQFPEKPPSEHLVQALF